MRGLSRATPIVIVATALAAATCKFPTDKSNSVFVTVAVPKSVVLQGQKLPASATLWQRTGTDSAQVQNAVFEWTSDDDSIATVKDEGFGGAEVTGVNSGTVTMTVRAPMFEKAQAAYVTLRVSKPLEIDSVRPKIAHHGDVITIYGVGVDSLFIASLAGVNLIEYPFSRARAPDGVGRISYWVPPPARTDALFYLGAGVFGFDTAKTAVIYRDLYEPNDTSPDGPTTINLDQQGPWPGTALAPIVFANPALAFEPVERSTSGEDWFRFVTGNSNQAVTVFITYPQLGGDTSGTRIFLTDSLYYDTNNQPTKDPIEKFLARDSSDFIGSAFSRCKTDIFAPPMAPRESTVVALKSLPSKALHILTNFTRPQRYGLTVAHGYFTADSRIQPDAYEENDMCTYADSGNRRITLATNFSDTLTIDNPHEVDWLRIDVSGAAGPLRLQTISRPFSGAAADTSDLDLYLFAVPNPATGQRMALVALDTSRGSANSITVPALAAGSYYVAVVDFAGAPMRYALCMARGLLTPCNLIAATPPLAGSAALAPSGTSKSGLPRRGLTRRGPLIRPADGPALVP